MDDTYRVYHRVLSLAGIQIFAEYNWNSKLWLILQTFNAFVGFLTFIFTSIFVIDNVSDLPMFIEGACIWTTGVIMFISLLVCLKFHEKFRSFLLEMAFKDAALEIPFVNFVVRLNTDGVALMGFKQLVLGSQERLLTFTRLLLQVYVISVFVTASLYILGTVYEMAVREDAALRLLAFQMWFPWSLVDLRVYVASFIFHAYAGYLCCVAYPGFQCTIILLVGQTIRQLKILTYALRNLESMVQEITGSSHGPLWQECCTDILSQCVQHYTRLRKFGSKVNSICRPFYLTLILDAIMLVCVCSVKIATSKMLSLEVLKYYVHEFCFVMVVLMFCLLGQELQNQCDELDRAVFERWYIYDRRHKLHLKIFKMATKQLMPIYIFGSITLSLPTFTWFIKTGMSFFTLMMSFLDEDD